VHVWTNASVFAKLTLLIGLAPMAMGIAYAIRPGERRLALMRPLSLSSIFAALCSMLAGVIAMLTAIGADADPSGAMWRRGTVGLAESLVPPFLTFAFLVVAWISVAVGMRRQRD
jgi:hypothetical protein